MKYTKVVNGKTVVNWKTVDNYINGLRGMTEEEKIRAYITLAEEIMQEGDEILVINS